MAIDRHRGLRRVGIESIAPANTESKNGSVSKTPKRIGLLALFLIGAGLFGSASAIDAASSRDLVLDSVSARKSPATSKKKAPAKVRRVVKGKRAPKPAQNTQPSRETRTPSSAPAAVRNVKVAKSATSRRPAAAATLSDNALPSALAKACKERIDAAIQPARTVKLAEECEREHPNDPLMEDIRRIASGARQAMEVQRAAGLSADIFEDTYGDVRLDDLIRRASRGDGDAAYQIARTYKDGRSGIAANTRRMEQWLRFSAELGNGRASWELAEFYNYGGLVADAARFEKKAQELGYNPGARLPSRGY